MSIVSQFFKPVKAELLKNDVNNVIKTLRLLKLPFQRQTAQQVDFVDQETAVVSGEAQTVGTGAVILEASLTPPSQLTRLAQRQPGQPRTGEPLRVPLLPQPLLGRYHLAL